MPRKGNRILKNRNNQRLKRGFRKVGRTNKLYHNKIPRTLQIATRRPNSETLRFVKNLTYYVMPQTAMTENIFLSIRANSIYDILYQNGKLNQAGTWNAQDPEYNPSSGLVVNADGYNDWNERFQHFCVLGSKVQVTYQPNTGGHDATGTSARVPSTLYITLSGAPDQVTHMTPMRSIAKLPYLKRAQIMANNEDASGARLYSFYSARKFEGVKDPSDNSQLKGNFSNVLQSPSEPHEKSYFNIGLVPTAYQNVGSAGQPVAPGGIMRVKIEYIVRLTEPTDTNQVSVNSHMPVPFMV